MAQPGTPSTPALEPATSQPEGFKWNEVPPQPAAPPPPAAPPSLGALAAFVGDWRGVGLNTIFRPESTTTPTPLPTPASSDNVLEINLTAETLSFSKELGRVPNRGMVQGDVFLNGVHYLQSIEDTTTEPHIGVHLEPGLWMIVEPTGDPSVPLSVARMASIPHGTTICAQGLIIPAAAGPPTIPPVDITPFSTGSPGSKISFPSQQATNAATTRIPQDLSSFIAAGTITQDILTDPNTVLRNANRRSERCPDHRNPDRDDTQNSAIRRRDRQHRVPARRPIRGQQSSRARRECSGDPGERDVLDRASRLHRRASRRHRRA
jgi:hypothetical protein